MEKWKEKGGSGEFEIGNDEEMMRGVGSWATTKVLGVGVLGLGGNQIEHGGVVGIGIGFWRNLRSERQG